MGGGKRSDASEIGDLTGDLRFSSPARYERGSYSSADRAGDEKMVESRDNGIELLLGRLEELRIADEEPQLSKEEINFNDQRQEDEMLALEAIYGDSVVNLDRKGGLRLFQILVHYELPHDYNISAKLKGKGEEGGLGKDDDSDGFLYTFKVQYLPPVVLTCLLPLSYPSHHAPYFTIHAPWLDSTRTSGIRRMMDAILMEQEGQEVIYQWVEWLKMSSLSHIGFGDGIMLGEYGISLEQVIPLMISYNDERNSEAFLNNLQICAICFEESAGQFMVNHNHLFRDEEFSLRCFQEC